ncbi:unnamed protein product [Gongylonema pulchrum]|uniref:DUF4283 domain-containing protein n=1 Tax=Gongylonema pulchrum TaxID=637853 RepID=A0A183D289_9BILA|nr:unnamed protein product [Gongylonema pulchrum]
MADKRERTGVIVSRSKIAWFVWTPEIGEGIIICNDDRLFLGQWIKFAAMIIENRQRHVNIGYYVADGWSVTPAVLNAKPRYNNLLLESKIYVSNWQMDKLEADWVGPVSDRYHAIEESTNFCGLQKTYTVVLKRVRKSDECPVCEWVVTDLKVRGSVFSKYLEY